MADREPIIPAMLHRIPETLHRMHDDAGRVLMALGGRLGRHIEHDERSRMFPSAQAPVLVTTMHKRHVPPWDQGDVGACTGFAEAGMLMTEPIVQPAWNFGPKDALRLYSQASHLDGFPGAWPPFDTGSSGLAVMKAAVKDKYLTSYTHTFALPELLGALGLTPGILGISWYSTFDTPLPTGECVLGAGAVLRGGHEIEAFGINVELKQVWCYQSWGPTWGGLKNGTMWFSWDTMARLLAEHADASFPVA
jgi:hypothetical protein